jgi:hypothetical protein
VILSSSDIYNILNRDPILAALATVRITEGRPPLEAGNGVYIYIKKYPVAQEFEVSWDLWIVDFDNEPLDVLINQLRRLLPRFTIEKDGAIVKASTTELKTTETELEPVKEPPRENKEAVFLDEKFEELRQSIEDRMLLARPGRAGKDGKDGRDGRDGLNGKDGKDLVATDAELQDLKDVFVDDAKRGQFLMFDGASWVNRFVPQILKGSGAGGGIEEAPKDGNYYLRHNGEWVDIITVLASLNLLDAGDFTLGVAETASLTELNGGDFSP